MPPAAVDHPGVRRMPSRRLEPAIQGWLLLTTVALMLVQGIATPSSIQAVISTALAGATLVLAFTAAKVRPGLRTGIVAFALAALAVTLFRVIVGGISEGPTLLVNAVLTALGPPAIAVSVVRDVRARGHVGVSAVAGVLALYILIGMFFGFLFGTVDRLGGAPFFANDQVANTSNFLYFSFTTMTTVGYGDFTARTNLGHTLAVTEALIGQIYLVTVVSLIVGNLGRPARTRPD